MPEQMEKKVVITAGKPLRVDVATFYTGNIWGGKDRKKDLLITSFRKQGEVSEQGLRSIHYHEDKAEKNRPTSPSAADRGSGLIFFDPFLSKEDLDIDIHVLSRRLNFEGIGKAGDIMASIGKMIPFAQVGGFLIAGGKLLSLGAKISKQFTSDRIEFRSGFVIKDGAKFSELEAFFADENERLKILDQHTIFDDGIRPPILVNKSASGKAYDGDVPYIILRFTTEIDSEKLERLKNYHNQIETLINLSRFIPEEKKPVELDDIKEGIGSILDLRHFQGILKTLKELEADSKDSEKNVEKVQELLKRLELIQNGDLKDILSEKLKKHQNPES